RYLVQRLQTLCPRLGKVKMAQMLARAGLHLGVSSVGRMRRQRPAPTPRLETRAGGRGVSARYPNHLWHIDLTTVPTAAGASAAEAATFADRAVAVLRDAINAGWAQPSQLKEPDFDPLRGRSDFQVLVANVEAKFGSKAKPQD